MTDIFKEAALRVGGSYADLHSGEKQFALDPNTVLVFLDIIKEVVQMWANCKADGVKAKQIADNPGPMQKNSIKTQN